MDTLPKLYEEIHGLGEQAIRDEDRLHATRTKLVRTREKARRLERESNERWAGDFLKKHEAESRI